MLIDQIDNALIGSDEFFGGFVNGRDPAERLVRRGNIVAV